eukprot:scaffold17291_cov127-Isochrysis_galbana.AAC.3
MLAILARQVTRIRAKSLSQPRPFNRAWFSPLSLRCLRPCTPPVRLFSVYSLRVQPPIRQGGVEGARLAAVFSKDVIGAGPHGVPAGGAAGGAAVDDAAGVDSLEVWKYKLSGGALLTPHRLYMCLQDSSRPRKGYEKAPARRSISLGTRGLGSFSRPLVPSLPRRHVLGKCACFCAEGIGSPSPAAKEGGLSCGGLRHLPLSH